MQNVRQCSKDSRTRHTLRIQVLMGDLFPKAATPFLRRSHVSILGCQLPLQKPSTEFRTELNEQGVRRCRNRGDYDYAHPSLLVQGLDDQHERRLPNLCDDLQFRHGYQYVEATKDE